MVEPIDIRTFMLILNLKEIGELWVLDLKERENVDLIKKGIILLTIE